MCAVKMLVVLSLLLGLFSASTGQELSTCPVEENSCYLSDVCAYVFNFPAVTDDGTCESMEDSIVNLQTLDKRLETVAFSMDELGKRIDDQRKEFAVWKDLFAEGGGSFDADIQNDEELIEGLLGDSNFDTDDLRDVINKQQQTINEFSAKITEIRMKIGKLVLKEVDSVTLDDDSYMYDMAHFAIDKDSYVALKTWFYLYLYKISSDGKLTRIYRHSVTPNYGSVEHLEIDGRHLLIVGSAHTNATIYEWTFQELKEIQVIVKDPFYVRDSTFVKFGGRTFLYIALFKELIRGDRSPNYSIDNIIYEWDGEKFIEFQKLNHQMSADAIFLQIEGELYLHVPESAYSNAVSIDYKLSSDGTKFEYAGDRYLDGSVFTVASFENDGNMYVIEPLRSSTGFETSVYKWNRDNSMFEFHQSLEGDSAWRACPFMKSGMHYVLLVNYKSETVLFRYEDDKFVKHQTVDKFVDEGVRAYSCMSFEYGPITYVMIDRTLFTAEIVFTDV